MNALENSLFKRNLTDFLSKVLKFSQNQSLTSSWLCFQTEAKLLFKQDMEKSKGAEALTWSPDGPPLPTLSSQMFSESKDHIFIYFCEPPTVSCVYPIRHTSLTSLTHTALVRPSWLSLAASENQGVLPAHSAGLCGSTLHTLGEKTSCFLLSRYAL